MSHKAYAFDWHGFYDDLQPVLYHALESNNGAHLQAYIDTNLEELSDPYEGDPLTSDWRSQLESIDNIHELGDYALTRFYDPSEDCGIGELWLELEKAIPEIAQIAMLGRPLGPSYNAFDPGRMGSYFQRPDDVAKSIDALANVDHPSLSDYQALLARCQAKNRGVYITF